MSHTNSENEEQEIGQQVGNVNGQRSDGDVSVMSKVGWKDINATV